jgi:hypothetical protein
MVEIAEADARSRYEPREPVPDGKRWSQFRERKDRTNHVRHMFVAKYAPAMWGDPWADPDPWTPVRPTYWVSDEPGGARSCPDLGRAVVGDLLVVMRLEYRHQWEDPPGQLNWLEPADDPSPFEGRPKLIGVWHVVRRRVRRWPSGPNRPAAQLWHLPLVRFADDDAVDVRSLRRLDPTGVGSIRPFRLPNDTLVACEDGNETALLAAACSLPSDVFTTGDLVRLAGLLAGQRCGMQDHHRKYWRDLQYQHHVRGVMEETAIRTAERRLADEGWDVDNSTQRVPRWGGDLDCWRARQNGGIEKMCVEVKGTRFDPWQGHVHLQRSQRSRASRAASGRPLPNEVGYNWELHVQAGIAANHTRDADSSLPPLDARTAAWVDQYWQPDWVA